MPDRYLCQVCSKVVAATANQRYRTHINESGERCENASVEIPEHLLAAGPETEKRDDGVPKEGRDFNRCPHCGKNVKLTRMGYFESHNTTLYGGDRCPNSGVRFRPLKKVEDVLLPGDEPASAVPKKNDAYQPVASRGLAITAAPTAPTSGVVVGVGSTTASVTPTPPETPDSTPPADMPEPARSNLERQPMEALTESTTTSTPSPEPESAPSPATSSDAPGSPAESAAADPAQPDQDPGPFSLGRSYSERFRQPGSPFLQPGEIPPKISLADSMSERGKEIAARLRETFYAYTNRNSSDNRSAQKTLGPSEAGSPCDRQIAMKLLGIKPTNPQEGWAPFVGTAVHVELAKMFEWANGSGSGRYVTEMPLSFGNAFVPRGTSDLLDRTLYMILDHKLMGSWSLKKLIEQGPSETYRIQGQIYGLGAVLAGEKVREIAIIGWPRQESSLDKLYVHVEPFDRKVAEAALQRVERIAEEVAHRKQRQDAGHLPLEVAKQFPAGDDCRWCPFHLKNDKGFARGCPGK